MKKIKRWFGADTDSEVDSSENDDINDGTWNKVDRKKANDLKKKHSEKKKKNKIALEAKKASHILGISPITESEINFFRKENYYETAKWLAVEQYLKNYLMYTNEELADIKLCETKAPGINFPLT